MTEEVEPRSPIKHENLCTENGKRFKQKPMEPCNDVIWDPIPQNNLIKHLPMILSSVFKAERTHE